LIEQGSKPVISGNDGSGNKIDGIELMVSGMAWDNGSNFVWNKNPLPYTSQDAVYTIPNGVSLEIEPGSVIKFRQGKLKIEGVFKAQGQAGQKIIFTSFKDDELKDTNRDGSSTLPSAGDWVGVEITAGAKADLKNIEIRYGGKDGANPLNIQDGANVTQEDIIIAP